MRRKARRSLIAKAAALYRAGKTSSQVAYELGVEPSTVYKYLADAGVPVRSPRIRLTPSDKQTALQMYFKGHTVGEIAEFIGCCDQALYDTFGQMKRGEQGEYFQQMYTHYEATIKKELLTVQEAAEYLSVSPRTIYNWVKTGAVKAYRARGSRLLRFKKSELTSLLVAA